MRVASLCHVTSEGGNENAHKIIRERKRSSMEPSHRWVYGIKMYRKEIQCKGTALIQLV
jgi:hypothetical protein